jgi:hypothetical protein
MPNAMVAVKHMPALLEIHGEADRNVPVAKGEELVKLASPPELTPLVAARRCEDVQRQRSTPRGQKGEQPKPKKQRRKSVKRLSKLILDFSLAKGKSTVEQFADNAGRFVSSLDSGRHHFVIGGAHAVKFEPGHQLENVSTLHQATWRRRS